MIQRVFLICLFVLTICLPVSALQAQSFVIKDIRIEGLQRINSGSVFSSLPFRVGETADAAMTREAIKTLFASGNFDDIKVGEDNGVLVLIVSERPSIVEINIEGNKALPTEALMAGLNDAGLAQGRIFKRATLEGIRMELQRQYVAQGRYDAQIEAKVETLPKNRVAINIDIDEGSVAKIKHVNIVGNKAFSRQTLLDEMKQRSTGFWSFITSSDKYSKERLRGDLEALESFYRDRGYIKFQIESTQVSISPKRDAVYITINVNEGDVYTIDKVELAGEMVIPEMALRLFVLVRPGNTYSQALITQSEKFMTQRLGNDGYTFAKVSAVPDINEEDKTVAIKFYVDPKKRTYVRRINFKGNTKSSDEVLRREMRQMEGAPAAGHKIEQSRVRIERLGFFKNVEVDTVPVPGVDDQVDVTISVEEQPSGSIGASIGYSDGSGAIYGANLQQNNFLGSGNQVGVAFNKSDYQTSYRFNFLDPYYTEDGVSRGFGLYYKSINTAKVNLTTYNLDTLGGNVYFGYPIKETQRLRFGLGVSTTKVHTGPYVVQEIENNFSRVADASIYTTRNTKISVDPDGDGNFTEGFGKAGDVAALADPFTHTAPGFVNLYGRKYDNWTFSSSWVQNKLNRGVFATAGYKNTVSLEVSLPGSDLSFYKLRYNGEKYFQLNHKYSIRLHMELGYGGGYGDLDRLPFYEHFYAGGFGSVRGFNSRTLGPRSTEALRYQQALIYTDPATAQVGYILGADQKFETQALRNSTSPFGGNLLTEGGVEFIFPMPFVKDTSQVRTVAFWDVGNVFSTTCSNTQLKCSGFDASELRQSVGLGLTWITAMGPLTFSIAKPFNYDELDRRKVFQFSLGTGF